MGAIHSRDEPSWLVAAVSCISAPGCSSWPAFPLNLPKSLTSAWDFKHYFIQDKRTKKNWKKTRIDKIQQQQQQKNILKHPEEKTIWQIKKKEPSKARTKIQNCLNRNNEKQWKTKKIPSRKMSKKKSKQLKQKIAINKIKKINHLKLKKIYIYKY